MAKKRILVVLGTRPEAVKMAPVIAALRRRPDAFDCTVCTTSQHRELLARTLRVFELEADYDLGVMQVDQSPLDVLSRVLRRLGAMLEASPHDWLLVQGDTTSALAAALAAAQLRVPIAHIEAGLRTHDDSTPWPEETNRRLVDALSSLHFAPTELAMMNLLREGVKARSICVTGNTGIDALLSIRQKPEPPRWTGAEERRCIVITFHRRESIPDGIAAICRAIVLLAERFTDCDFIAPLHPNPNIRAIALPILCAGQARNIRVLDALDYPDFIALLSNCYLVLTDSGGVEEEAPYLGKPVLVLRGATDRPEIVDAGTARLVGTDTGRIVDAAAELLQDRDRYERMSRVHQPYGDGHAAERIVAGLLDACERDPECRNLPCI